jgi:hypothetical protein
MRRPGRQDGGDAVGRRAAADDAGGMSASHRVGTAPVLDRGVGATLLRRVLPSDGAAER